MDQIVFLNYPEYLFYLIYSFLTGLQGIDIADEALALWEKFAFWSYIFSLLVLTLIFYSAIRLRQVIQAENIAFYSTIISEDDTIQGNEKWSLIIDHINSENPNDWRQSVIEADILLDSALAERGYSGETLGERLKMLNKGDLTTLNSAWEAHRLRNRLAHEGSDFILTSRDARRAIDQYREVLQELQVL